MINLKLAVTAILIIASIAFTFADVVPGRWDKVATLAPGTRIFVEMESGDRIQGQFAYVSDVSLAIDAGNNNRMTLPKSGITRVLKEGGGKRQTVLGTGVGVGIGVATGLAISTKFDETFFARKDLMAISCGGIGALVGALIGHSIGGDPEEVLFRSR